jgi:hypothetical protein
MALVYVPVHDPAHAFPDTEFRTLTVSQADPQVSGGAGLVDGYDEGIDVKEATTSEAAFSGDRDAALGRDEFHRSHPLGELLTGAEPIDSLEELRIGALADEEADAFLAALGS